MERGPCSLWSRLKGRGPRCVARHPWTTVEASRSGSGVLWTGPVRLGRVCSGGRGLVRSGWVGCAQAVEVWFVSEGYAVVRRSRRGMPRRRVLWFVGQGSARQGQARCVRAVKVRRRTAWLGVLSFGGPGQVRFGTVRRGSVRRSRCAEFGQGPAGYGVAVMLRVGDVR